MADDAAAVRAVLQRTIAAGSARILTDTENTWRLPEFPADTKPAWRTVMGAGRFAWKTVGSPLLRLATHGADIRHRAGEGIIDFTGRRFMIDYGSYATVGLGNREWGGRSGRARSTLPDSAARVGSPLWLVDLLGGITAAEGLGPDQVEDADWRRFMTTASLADASSGLADGMATPQHDRFDDLLRLQVEVWSDAERLRRIRFVDKHSIETVTFSDFGISLEDLDWDRLPTFRSPNEARS